MPPWVSFVNHYVTLKNVNTGPGASTGITTYSTVKRVEFDFRRSCLSVMITNNSESPVKEYDLEAIRDITIAISPEGIFQFVISNDDIP